MMNDFDIERVGCGFKFGISYHGNCFVVVDNDDNRFNAV